MQTIRLVPDGFLYRDGPDQERYHPGIACYVDEYYDPVYADPEDLPPKSSLYDSRLFIISVSLAFASAVIYGVFRLSHFLGSL